MARKVKKIIKTISKLPFEIQMDFMIGNSHKYKNNKKVIDVLKKEDSVMKKEFDTREKSNPR